MNVRERAFWGILAVALLTRTLLLLRYPQLRGMGDETVHYATGLLISHFGLGVPGHWPPGYDLLLGLLFRLFGPDPLAVRIVQIALSTMTVGFVYGLARRAGGPRAAWIAGAVCALDPTLVAYTQYLFSETLFIALLTGAAWLLFARTEPRPTDVIGAGLLFGLAVLTRSVALYFLPLWIAWALFSRRRDDAVRAAVVLGVALAVVLPWTVRNAVKYHGFVLVDGTPGRTAYFAFSEVLFNQDLGFLDWRRQLPRSRPPCVVDEAPGVAPLPPVEELVPLFPPDMKGLLAPGRSIRGPVSKARSFAMLDVASRQRCEIGRALEFTLERPGVVAANAARRFYAFWGPNSFLLRWVHAGVYPDGPLGRGSFSALKWLVVALHVLAVGAAILAFGRPSRPPLLAWIGLFVGYYTAIHLVAVAYSRYRLPLAPMVAVCASFWLASPGIPQGRVRRIGVGAAMLGFLCLSAHYAFTRLP